jgi:hypothetical protein
MEGELCGPADDRHGLLGILDPWKFDDDPPLPGTLEARLGHTQLVDPAPEDLERPADGVRVNPSLRGVSGLEDDLGSAAQVEAEAGWTSRNDRHGRPDHKEDGKGAPPQMWGHGYLRWEPQPSCGWG